MKITEADIIKAIQDAASKEPDRPANVIRAVELQERLGMGHVQVRNLLRRMMAEGKAEPVKCWHRDLAGRLRRIEMYRIVELPE